MKEVARIDFVDVSANDNGFALVYADRNRIGLTLSLEHDGDIKVFFSPEDTIRLVEALHLATGIASGRDS